MAKDSSFDIVSQVDMQVMDDCVNVTLKTITTRFDLKDQNIEIDFNRSEKTITITASSEYTVNQVKDILFPAMIKRNLSKKVLSMKKREKSSGDGIREVNDIVSGIDKEIAKQIVKDIKEMKLKVQPSIQDDQVRVTGAKKDDLQTVISMLKEKDYPIPIQFINFR